MQMRIVNIWPDSRGRRRIQREIEHGQRVIVVLDGKPPTITLPRADAHRVPEGAVRIEGLDPAVCSLSIPPLTWLRPPDRRRGEAFVIRSEMIASATTPDRQLPSLVEDSLIGTPEPLRFVYQTGSLTIDALRSTISSLYADALPDLTRPVATPWRAPRYVRQARSARAE
jgi:hypothetical protein